MGIKKILGIIFQIPAWLLLGGSVFAGTYAWIKGINGIGISAPIILLGICVLYIAGRLMTKNSGETNPINNPSNPQDAGDRYAETGNYYLK